MPGCYTYSREQDKVDNVEGLPSRSLSSGQEAGNGKELSTVGWVSVIWQAGCSKCPWSYCPPLTEFPYTTLSLGGLPGCCLILAPNLHPATQGSPPFSLAVASPQTSTSTFHTLWGQEQIGLPSPGQGDQGQIEVWCHLWLSILKTANFPFILNMKLFKDGGRANLNYNWHSYWFFPAMPIHRSCSLWAWTAGLTHEYMNGGGGIWSSYGTLDSFIYSWLFLSASGDLTGGPWSKSF